MEIFEHVPTGLWILFSFVGGGFIRQIWIWAVYGFESISIVKIFEEFKEKIDLSLTTLTKALEEMHEESTRCYNELRENIKTIEKKVEVHESIINKMDNLEKKYLEKNKDCLLIEDDIDNLILVEIMLKEKYNVTKAKNYLNAITALKGKCFDFIISDLQLDNGKTALDIIKFCNEKEICIDNNNKVKIIIYSGSVKEIKYNIDLGTVTLTKPLKKEDLFKAINYIM